MRGFSFQPTMKSSGQLLSLIAVFFLAALFAAELALDNQARLESLLGRAVSPAEIYLAHFLGVASAARIKASSRRRTSSLERPARSCPSRSCCRRATLASI